MAVPVPKAAPVAHPVAAASSANPDSVEAPVAQRSRGLWLELVIFAFFTTALLGGTIGIVAWKKGWKIFPDKAKEESNDITAIDSNTELTESSVAETSDDSEDMTNGSSDSEHKASRWHDPSKSLVLNRFRVQITSVEIAEVLAKDERRQVIPTDGQLYLQVHLKLQNIATTPVDYRSWYLLSERRKAGDQVTRLIDDLSQRYPLKHFSGVEQLNGHTASATLQPQEHMTDVLVFAIPSNVNRQLVTRLRLILPATAIKADGEFRFEIPVGQIADW